MGVDGQVMAVVEVTGLVVGAAITVGNMDDFICIHGCSTTIRGQNSESNWPFHVVFSNWYAYRSTESVFSRALRFDQGGSTRWVKRDTQVLSKGIKDALAREVRSKTEVGEVVSHLVSRHLFKGELEFSHAVKLLLRQCLSPADVKRKNIAAKLCTSERTLVRKLKREGVSYRQLVDEFRKERCIVLLQRGVTTSTELAEYLCFSDCGYVYRAFHRWTGTSLGEAKYMLAQNPDEFVSIFHPKGKSGDAMLIGASESMRSGKNAGGKQMRELTVRETEEVGGAVAPIVAVFAGRAAYGGFVGAAGYAG